MILSFIVPVYNVEAYLEKCVESILAQDISVTEYEIILIDDGSTDCCGEICDRLTLAHPNVVVIHQSNAGLGAARNTGIQQARGKYIQFVDSDDSLLPGVIGGLLERMETERLDILRFNYQCVDEAGQPFEPNKYSKPYVDYSDTVCDGKTFLEKRLGFACYACQFIFAGGLVRQPSNLFQEGIHFEDTEWTPRILSQAERVSSTPIIAYNYLYRQDSITRSVDPAKKRKSLNDRLTVIASLQEQRHNARMRNWYEGMIAHMALSILADVSNSFFPEYKTWIQRIKALKVFPMTTYHATRSAIKKIRLANFSPELFCLLFHLKADKRRTIH